MKILLYGINHAPEIVGIGQYSGDLAQWMAARGHEVRVITAPPYFPQWRALGNRYQLEWLGHVAVQRCPLWVPAKPNGLTRLLHLASFALSSLPPLLLQRAWHPDIVVTVAPAFFCAPGALLFCWLSGRQTRSWLHIQDYELDAAFELGMLKGSWIRDLAQRWERRTLRGFDRVSTISQPMRQKAIEKTVEAPKAILLPNWVNLKAIRPLPGWGRATNSYRQQLGLSNETIVFMYSGSMNRKQGLELLVAVIDDLSDLPELVWLLAGEGPSREELAAATVGKANVRMLPLQPIDRLNDWLNLADVHLLPQKAGAADLVLPSKLLGILASGRPFVASSPAGSELGQLAERAGLRVEPEDAKGFASALRRLAGDPALRRERGAAARLLAEERYGREAVLGRLELELQALVDERRR